MTVKWNEEGDLVYIDKKGNEIEIDVRSMSCDACWNTHLEFSIPVLNFESECNRYYGDYSDFDEYDRLNEEIEDHLRISSSPQHIS